MAEKYDSDVVIAGGGPAGLTLAALLAERGVTSIVVDRIHPRDLAKPTHDARTTALSYGTVQLLKELGFWDDLVKRAEPILTIDIRDGKAPLLLHFGTEAAADIVQTDATPDGVSPMGWIVENHDLRNALWQAVEKRAKHCRVMTPCRVTDYAADETGVTVTVNDEQTIRTRLLIGADGRMSAVRDLAGVEVVALDYQQIATIGLIAHEKPHGGRAVEHFMSDGPFAVLPFTDDPKGDQGVGRHRSAIVWTRSLNARQRRQVRNRDLSEIKLSQADLQAEIAARIDPRYGALQIVGTWDHYPLSLYHATALTAERVALVGDAAHAIHPIAGQGLNVGMQDIGYLVDLLGQTKQAGGDLGSSDVLEAYQTERRFKVFTMVAATDGLNRLFGLTSLPLKIVRTLGLGAVQATPKLKRFFVKRAMGL